ncbi:MAG: HigA family addiction module antitoxin [Polaromonas sp.]|nr:HigA family addiction module antitoxin [Polaromonas sp.]
MALSQTRAAQLLGVSRRRINELTQGHRAMSADTAIRCAMAFGVRADFWLALQANWDSFYAWRALRRTPEAASGAASCATSD